MLTQIYEVSTPEEARSISEVGLDHIGVLVGDGEFPRELPVEMAAKVAAAILAPSKLSALFLTTDLSLIEKWARQLQPAILHLGAAPELLSPDDAATLKGKLPGMLLMRRAKRASRLPAATRGSPISCSWTAIENSTARSARSG